MSDKGHLQNVSVAIDMYVPRSFSHFLLTPNPETYPTQERHGNARPSTASQIRHLKSSVSLSFKTNFIYFWLYCVFIVASFSCGEQGRGAGYSVFHSALGCPWGASLEHKGLSSCSKWAQQLWLLGSKAPGQGFSFSEVYGILLDQESNPHLLLWPADSLPSPPEKP